MAMLRFCCAVALISRAASQQGTCAKGSASCVGVGEEGRGDGVCFALIATEFHWKELEVRVSQILKHQHYEFSRKYIVLDTDGQEPSKRLADSVQNLVNKGLLDQWLLVDYSPEYIRQTNQTANWDPEESRPPQGYRAMSYTQFAGDWQEKERPAQYFAIDQCSDSYLVLMDIEVIWMSYRQNSWVASGLQLLRDNPGLVLVMPAYPGIEYRQIREKPLIREIEKDHPLRRLHSPKLEAEDTTCWHPWTLAGWANLLDLKRYEDVGPRQNYKEYRCAGMLVKGRRCKEYEYMRGCGGMRLWEDALECVICNRRDLRQAQLTDSDRVWVQKAPMTCFRSDVGDMIDRIKAVENGTVFPVSGMNFIFKEEEDEESDT